MNAFRLLLAGLCCALVVAGCSERSAPDASPSAASQADTAESAPPPTKEDTLRIEGRAEPVILRRYQTPSGFPLPFFTYVPENMRAQRVEAGTGETIRFLMGADRTPADVAIVEFYLYPSTASEAEVRKIMQEKAASFGSVSQREPQEAWSLATYAFQGEQLTGRIALGQHDSTFFYVLQSHPPEFGEGFAPRAQAILDHWRWQDTGSPSPLR